MSSIQLFNDANLEDLYWDTARIRIVIKLHLLNFKKYSTMILCFSRLDIFYVSIRLVKHFLNDPTVYFSKINEVQESRRTMNISGKTRLDYTLVHLHVNLFYAFFDSFHNIVQILQGNT